jgi:hypothetical protein
MAQFSSVQFSSVEILNLLPSYIWCAILLKYQLKIATNLPIYHNEGVPLPLLLSIGLLPTIHVAATVVLKQKGDLLIEAIPRVPTE